MDSADYLEWPFFEPRHRALNDKLAAGRGKGRRLPSPARARPGGPLPAIDVRSLCLIRESLAFHSGIADCAFAIQGLGSAPITLFGNAALKQKYLPGVIEGKRLGAFALSEPESGSDVASLRTTARRDGDGYVLNGAKTWISNAGIANHYIVFARTGEPGDAKGLAAFVVEAGIPGLAITEKIDIVGPHVIGTLIFNDCRVDASALLGEPGEGFRIAMSTLDIFRATVGAAALGFARRALHEAIDRVGRREGFGQTLAHFQATQMRIADMAGEGGAAALLAS